MNKMRKKKTGFRAIRRLFNNGCRSKLKKMYVLKDRNGRWAYVQYRDSSLVKFKVIFGRRR